MSALVRDERAGEESRVREIHTAAFGRDAEARLNDVLRATTSPQLSLVAEQEGRVVGHAFFSPMRIDTPGAPAVGGLGPIGVDPGVQGRGLGSALVRHGLARAPALGWRAVFLLGSRAYYARFGFVPASPLGLGWAREPESPHFQVAELEGGALEGCRGPVHYSPPFDEV